MSSSVQLDSGNTRMCSPLWCAPLYRFHSSGRWLRGSHWPKSSRKLNTRSLARAFSSSRRAPPNSASNRYFSTASSSTGVWIRLRMPSADSRTSPDAIASGTLATISWTPSSSTRRSRNASTSGKLWPVSTCMTGNGMRAGANAFSARRSITIESLPPENSSTGRSNSATTSRMMNRLSASRAARCDTLYWARLITRRTFLCRASTGTPRQCGEQPWSQRLATHHQIGQARIRPVVFQRSPVDSGSVHARGGRHSDRRRRVPLVLAAGVHVRVHAAVDHGGDLGPGRAHRHQFGTDLLGQLLHEGRRPAAAGGQPDAVLGGAGDRRVRRGRVGGQHGVLGRQRNGAGDQPAPALGPVVGRRLDDRGRRATPEPDVHGPVDAAGL